MESRAVRARTKIAPEPGRERSAGRGRYFPERHGAAHRRIAVNFARRGNEIKRDGDKLGERVRERARETEAVFREHLFGEPRGRACSGNNATVSRRRITNCQGLSTKIVATVDRVVNVNRSKSMHNDRCKRKSYPLHVKRSLRVVVRRSLRIDLCLRLTFRSSLQWL